MIQFLLISLLVLALISAAAIFIAISQNKRAKAAEHAFDTMHDAFHLLKEKAMRLREALEEIAKTEGEANAERKELAKTLDSDLVNRANSLFN